MSNYSQQPKQLKIDDPILFFGMQLDTPGNVINSLNQGRLSLWSYKHGYIHRWVATSSYDGKQGLGQWEEKGGIHPPNYVLDDAEWFWLDTGLIIQPTQPVKEGYLPLYRDSNNWTTVKGNGRSQVMFHCDDNYKTNPGSFGCVVFLPEEWKSFKQVIAACCGHLERIRYGVIYTFQP